MTAPTVHECQQHVQHLGSFCRAIRTALNQSAPASHRPAELLTVSISGECIQCGMRVTGEDLVAVSQADASDQANFKVKRLRQGYCARQGCDSYYYLLRFTNVPQVDWESVLRRAEAHDHESGEPAAMTDDASERRRNSGNWRRLLPILLILGVILVLLGVRQWYRGGRIPLIHEPEYFEVDRSETPPPGAPAF